MKAVLGVDVEYPGAKLVNVRDRVNELAEQMAGIPFQAEIGAFFRFVEQALPHGRLASMLKPMTGGDRPMGQCQGDADAALRANRAKRLPEFQQARRNCSKGL